MKKLEAARLAILAAPLGVKADKLLTFAQQGNCTSYRGDGNKAFSMVYTAHFIVTDFTGSPLDLFFVMLDWLHADNPAAEPDALKFHADIIDHGKADISMMVDLKEIVAAPLTKVGQTIRPVPDPTQDQAIKAILYGAPENG